MKTIIYAITNQWSTTVVSVKTQLGLAMPRGGQTAFSAHAAKMSNMCFISK